MNKRKLAAALAAGGAIAALVAFIVPSIARSFMVASFGVITADALTLIATVAAWAAVLVALIAVVYVTLAVVKAKRDKQDARRAMLSRNETDPNVIQRELERVAKKFGTMASTQIPTIPTQIRESIRHLRSVQDSIKAIDEIFTANLFLVIGGDESLDYTKVSLLLNDIRQEVYGGLIQIIYSARPVDPADQAACAILGQSIYVVNEENRSRIDATKKLAGEIAKVSAPGQASATDQLTTLVSQLSSRKQIAPVTELSADELLNPTATPTPQTINLGKETR
ncbi:MAG: hypothetical protein WBP12_02275 [Candidatus Saccharimonas sp.]